MAHNCEKELEAKYPSHAQARDGERWTCSCGKVFEHVCDEAEGCYWVPQIKQPHNKEASKVKARKLRTQAQDVGGLFPKRWHGMPKSKNKPTRDFGLGVSKINPGQKLRLGKKAMTLSRLGADEFAQLIERIEDKHDS